MKDYSEFRNILGPALDNPLFDPNEKEAAELLKERESIVRLLRRASSMPAWYLETDYTKTFSMEIPSLMHWRYGAALLVLHARSSAAAGDAETAAADLAAVWNMAVHLSTHPCLISCMISVSVDENASRGFEDVLYAAPASAEAYRAILAQPEYSLRDAQIRAWRMEEATGLSAFVKVMGGTEEEELFAYNPLPLIVLWRVYMLEGDLECYQSLMRRYKRRMSKPYYKERERIEEIGKEFRENKGGVFTAMMMPDISRSCEAIAEIEAKHRLAVLGIAATVYKKDKGKYPDDSSQLVPDYLPARPIDPFDGEFLRMRPAENGLLLYSVGRNGTDDQGAEPEQKNPTSFNWLSNEADLTFCLGSVYEERRLEPARKR
jgi:hypothetical protein